MSSRPVTIENPCLNCGTPLQDRFCQGCGQDSVDPPQDGLGLVRAFTAAVAGLESKAGRSLVALLVKPGELTRAYVEGQRVRYSAPVQVYLWCTTLFFVVQSFFPFVRLNPDTGQVVSFLSLVSIGNSLSDATLRRLADQGTSLSLFAERFDAAVTAYFPLLLLAIVFAVAGLMAVMYRKESALKHGVFALHWAAFYFTVEMVRQLLPRTGRWGVPVSMIAGGVTIVYLGIAMKTVYRRGWLGTALRALLTMALFSLLLGVWLWSTTALAERLA